MTESISTYLSTLCGGILPFYLAEGETEGYPYAVYEQTTQQWRTKDGVYQITTESSITVYSTDFDEAQTKVNQLKAVLDAGTTAQYILQHRATTKDCTSGVFSIELVYFVKQRY